MRAETLLKRQADAVIARQQPAITPILVDETTAAQMLGGVSIRHLYNLRKQGLPFVRQGARITYRPADLTAWAESHVERVDGGSSR